MSTPDTTLPRRGALRALLPALAGHRAMIVRTCAAALLEQGSLVVLVTLAAHTVGGAISTGHAPSAATAATLAALVVLRALMTWREMDLSHDLAYRVLAELRVRVFDGLARSAPARVAGRRSGDLAATAMADVEALGVLLRPHHGPAPRLRRGVHRRRGGPRRGGAVAARRPAPGRRAAGGGALRGGARARPARARVVLLDAEERQDVVALARAAVADGADLLGVGGGDGTQALVAAVAAEHGLPFLVIAAGTRNHFAMDLGLDRDDPAACLDALTDGVELRVDLCFAGDRPFVNNASFGVYGAVVQSPGYRDDKVGTALHLLPELLTRQRGPRLTARIGRSTVTDPQAVLISNNPYRMDDPFGFGRRARLDSGDSASSP
ncbi:hypothetical protein SGLAM104S_05927 [Streptomyces glaucescens]